MGLGMKTVEVTRPTVTVTVFSSDCFIFVGPAAASSVAVSVSVLMGKSARLSVVSMDEDGEEVPVLAPDDNNDDSSVEVVEVSSSDAGTDVNVDSDDVELKLVVVNVPVVVGRGVQRPVLPGVNDTLLQEKPVPGVQKIDVPPGVPPEV